MLYGPHGAFGQALTATQRAAQTSRRDTAARIAKAAQAVTSLDAEGAAASAIPARSAGSCFFARAWELLNSASPPRDQSSPRWTVQVILESVCDHYQVTPADVVSTSRTQELVVPRQIAMYLARTLTNRSLPEIGRRFGARRHTTVLHAVRKITSRMLRDPQLSRDISAITKKLKDRVARKS